MPRDYELIWVYESQKWDKIIEILKVLFDQNMEKVSLITL